MSRFSNKLKELFAVKNVDKMKVAVALHIDRALLYRYLNDQSFPPDYKFIEDLQKELFLTPFEYKELCDSFEITRLGDEICENREIIRRIINNIYYTNAAPKFPAGKPLQPTPTNWSPLTTICNFDEVFDALQSIIMDERSTSICMSLQPDRELVVSSLLPLISRQAEQRKIRVEHLIRFQSKTHDNPGVYNLEIFSHLVPVLYHCNYCTSSEYFAYFYYNNQAAVDERAMDLYPNTLITPWCTCLLKYDYSGAVILCDEFTAETYHQNFLEISKLATPFVIDTKEENSSTWMNEQLLQTHFSEYVFKSHPSVYLGITRNFYEKHPPASLAPTATKEERRKNFELRNQVMFSPTHDGRSDFFSPYGLNSFLDSGYFSTTYANGTSPLSKEEICEFLERYIAAMHENPHFSTHLIKSETPNAPTNDFSVYLLADNLLYIENPHRKENSTYVIQVTERSIIDAFSEYLKSGIVSEDRVLTKEQTLEYLQAHLDEMKKTME